MADPDDTPDDPTADALELATETAAVGFHGVSHARTLHAGRAKARNAERELQRTLALAGKRLPDDVEPFSAQERPTKP